MRLSDLPEIDSTLRPYQVTGKQEIYRAWDTCRTVLFQMPTGTGKTRLFSSIIKDIRRLWQSDKKLRKVLVLAHRTELIQQIDETLTDKYGIAHGIIKSGIEEIWNRDVQVASVQTIVRRLDKWTAKDFAYIIIDEAHHAVSDTYMKICKQFPEAKILGVTATPCRLTGDALRKLFGVLVVSQPITKFIEQNYLSPYSYYSIRPDSEVQRELDSISHFNVDGDYSEADMMRVVDTKKVRANIIEAYQKYAAGKKGIIYTINQQHNKSICEAFEGIGVKIKAIDSKTPDTERKTTVAQFKAGKIDIICNVNIFSEGFDCPDIEFIQLARPTCSLAMYLQQVGRGLRPHPLGIPATILDNVGSYNKFGLPSANRQWRRHFEGQGQRVTQSSMATGLGTRTQRRITEGDEDMLLIFNGTSLASQNEAENEMLLAIFNTKEWFPFGSSAILEPYQGIFNFKKTAKAAHYYNEYEDIDEWRDSVQDEIETCRMDPANDLKLEEIDWAEHHLYETYKFLYQGKYGLCHIISGEKNLEADIDLVHSGKKKSDEIVSLLLPPVYDEINIPDDQDRAICKKDGKYGVLSGESFLPIVPFEYDCLQFEENGLYVATKDGRVGLIDGNDIIIPIEHEEITGMMVSQTEILYAVSQGDHYYLVQFISGKEKNHQDKIIPLHHLVGDYYIGKSMSRFGYICDVDGHVKARLGFDRIGVRRFEGKAEVVLAVRHFAIALDDELNEQEGLYKDVPESNKMLISEFGLEELFIVDNTGITEYGIEPTTAEANKGTNASNDTIPSQTGVFVGKSGLKGYKKNDNIVIPPEYENIEVVYADRFIVTQNGRKGLLAIAAEEVKTICKPLFSGLSFNRNSLYRATFDDGFIANLDESVLKRIKEVAGSYRVETNKEGTYLLKYHNKLVSKFKTVYHLANNYFAIKEAQYYGIIHCKNDHWEFFRRCEYNKIELSPDKRNILLYKEGRPRFISISSLPE